MPGCSRAGRREAGARPESREPHLLAPECQIIMFQCDAVDSGVFLSVEGKVIENDARCVFTRLIW